MSDQLSPERIRSEFDRLNNEYDAPSNRGWKQYELSGEMLRLSQLHYKMTGKYLQRVPRKEKQP